MEYRRLGRSDLSLSVVSYGNWLTHGDGVDNAAAVACVRKALEAGITVIDTADMYADGRAERNCQYLWMKNFQAAAASSSPVAVGDRLVASGA
jgi:aryl-alcohol dehydrogenase-like predicted oxidoreductase